MVLAAYAARRLSRWASGGDGWLAFWFVGLLSPVLFYGADFWEHAPALALALLAVALVLEGGGRKVVSLGGLVAGLAAVDAQRHARDVRGARRCRAARARGAAPVSLSAGASSRPGCGALVGVLFVNVVDRALGARPGHGVGPRRWAGRASSARRFADRLRDAVITSVGVLANDYWLALVIGA